MSDKIKPHYKTYFMYKLKIKKVFNGDDSLL